jgi:hypothetical protein
MIAIEKEIDAFYKDTEESVNCIIYGSDEHLDLNLTVTKPLDRLSAKFEALNENLYNSIGNCSDDEIKTRLMPKLLDVNKTCMTLIGAIRTSMLYSDVRTSVKKFSKSHDFLREMIHDLKHFRINKDDEFDNLLNELNAI